jgi:hypothetical protein
MSISQEELNKLISLSGVKFDLPLNNETLPAFDALCPEGFTRSVVSTLPSSSFPYPLHKV